MSSGVISSSAARAFGTSVAASPEERSLTKAVLTLGGRVRRPRLLRGERMEHTVKARTITTDRLMLRPHRRADAAQWHTLQSDRRVVRFLDWPLRSARQSKRHLIHRTRHTRLLQADDFLALAVVHEGRLIGDVSLHLREVTSASRSVEIGWILSPEEQGRGFATEAAQAVIGLAFETVRATRIDAVINAQNDASIGLARKLGFATAGHRHGEVVMRLARD